MSIFGGIFPHLMPRLWLGVHLPHSLSEPGDIYRRHLKIISHAPNVNENVPKIKQADGKRCLSHGLGVPLFGIT